ncbi:MAG: P-protein [Bacteroidota bacterium]|jgi:prephenate dehydratase
MRDFFLALMNTKIAIQGIKGSNHYQVALDYFGEDIEFVDCASFDALVHSLVDQRAEFGVMAIENSIAGSIIPNYALMDKYQLSIVGEYYLSIHHHLMALPGQTLDQISEVHSHPMALLQCNQFFYDYPQIKLVESEDTAASALAIQRHAWKGIAAIAPKSSAELYGLEVLADDIQTIKNNATRFVVVTTQQQELLVAGANKASLRFVLDHKRGSLAAVLNALSDCSMNLTKIQSLPVIDVPWKYAFFVDITFEETANFEKAKALLSIMAHEFKVLGAYKNARL